MNEPSSNPPDPNALPTSAQIAKLERLRRKAQALQYASNLAALLFLLCNPLAVMLYTIKFPIIKVNIETALALSIASFPCIAGIRNVLKTQWRKNVCEMANLYKKQATGTLIEGTINFCMASDAKALLTIALPYLKANDALFLNVNHHRILRGTLSRNGFFGYTLQAPFLFAILKAYEQVGSADDLPPVERLARGEGYGRRHREIREAAQACLPYLQARSAAQTARETLLRASSASADDPANLLRPAGPADSTLPGQLLRPAEPNE